ncbi:Nuclear transcription factor Y subunit A [Dillenia turbinata]|uniref:Nuclear transcription factor Y subunit n=1 Tax=Dillenia turbinata TaxID=194707 RepID=A0AAN8UNW7_9MAGN
MQDLTKKSSNTISGHSTSPCISICPSWRNSVEGHTPQSSLSNGLSLKMGAFSQDCENAKQICFQIQDQDSSSTQSTGQSYPEVVSMGGSHLHGCSSIITKPRKATILVTSMGNQECQFPPQISFGQSLTPFPVPYHQPHFGGLFAAAYGTQALFHLPQVMGMAQTRVPLPLDLPHGDPVYVNAKQYRGILRRRQHRAKLETQNKLTKGRKPYRHESRHLHAIKRARGTGGRFLNMKNLEKSEPSLTTDGQDISGSAQMGLAGSISESEVGIPDHYKQGIPTTSCSDITNASDGDNVHRHLDNGLSTCPSRLTGMLHIGRGLCAWK